MPGTTWNEGLVYLDWLWQTRAEAFAYTHRFFGKPGLNVPMTADLLGRQIGGWHQYTHSATTAAWLAQHFYLHWRYSQDRRFLEERAYPYLAEVCSFLEAITEFDPNGKRFLPLSSSPEINDNRLEAWLPPTSNYDLALLHWSLYRCDGTRRRARPPRRGAALARPAGDAAGFQLRPTTAGCWWRRECPWPPPTGTSPT